MEVLEITPVCAPLDHEIAVPGSKSLSNRVLIAAALAEGVSNIENLLFAEDTGFLIEGLRRLGIEIEATPDERRARVQGCAGSLPVDVAEVDCGESGTMLRLLTAVCALGHGEYTLHGRGRLHERPMQALLEALQAMGTPVACREWPGHAPLTVHGRGLRGGRVAVDCSASSQFASAVLLAAVAAAEPVTVELSEGAVSLPYVELTLQVMRQFGVSVDSELPSRVTLHAPQQYKACDLRVESDASSATYFLAAAAICGGRVRVPDIPGDSMQGDLRFADLLAAVGCDVRRGPDAIEVRHPRDSGPLKAFQADCSDIPDAVPTAAVVALFADGPSRLSGVAHLRHKESDRLAALASELQRLGGHVVVEDNALTIQPPPKLQPATVQTYGDHRMAMALSLVGLAVEGLSVENPGCVSKSFPGFFKKLGALSKVQ